MCLLERKQDLYLCRPKTKAYPRIVIFESWFHDKSSLTRLEGIEAER